MMTRTGLVLTSLNELQVAMIVGYADNEAKNRPAC